MCHFHSWSYQVQAVQDHEKLLRARIKVRETPLALVAALKKGEGLDLPCPQVLVVVLYQMSI